MERRRFLLALAAGLAGVAVGRLLALVAERGLRTVTLAGVWAAPAQRLRGVVANGPLVAG
jgi:hypothetical protein